MSTGTRPRRRLSLNGLAIQVSAFALSFTLVALFVVGSSRAAFVEENETVTSRQEQAAPAGPARSPRPDRDPPRPPTGTPAPEPPPAPSQPVEPPAVQEVGLTDDSTGTALYVDENGLVPGVPEERCIRVIFDGSAAAQPVVLYTTSAEGPLAPFLDVTVEMGEDGGFGDCSAFTSVTPLFAGTLRDLSSAHGDYDTGLATWKPRAPEEFRSFRFTVAVRDDPAAEGLSASFGFTWEVRTG